MNVYPTLHVKTVVTVPTQMVHTVAFAQRDGMVQTVQQVKKKILLSPIVVYNL
jgi:hypothetical protein